MIESTAELKSALYVGRVVHARRAPAHAFRASLYFYLFDLSELNTLDRRLGCFGYNRVRPASLWDGDHLGTPVYSIAQNLQAFLEAHGVSNYPDRVFLLTQCRVLGYVFNPISVYYCMDALGQLTRVVAEVHNTYGEVHAYLLESHAGSGELRGEHKKVFHVSPFMSLDGTYSYAFSSPGATIDARLDLMHGGLKTFGAQLTLRRVPISDRALLGMLIRYPLMPQRVLASIHWQALKLWRKGAQFRSKPAYDPVAALERAAR
ncbi:MAG: DUF1365 domain-containing protein [Chloroflexota bacterium]|nr:DUF1365 domain-containing protein [Chloroflexota bacterium]